MMQRAWLVLERWTSDDVHAACHDLSQRAVADLSGIVDVPRVLLVRDAAAARVLRNRLRRTPTMTKAVVELLARPTLDLVVAALGDDRSADPSFDDLLEVLPDVIERHGSRRVALLLAFAVDDEWAAAEPCRRLLDTDSRFELDALGKPADDAVAPTTRRASSDADPAAPRSKRREKPRRGRSTTATTRPRYKKKAPVERGAANADDSPTFEPVDGSGVTVNGRPIDLASYARRDVRIVGDFGALERSDELVGRIVFAEVVFDGPVAGAKPRPCVVVAASGRDHLVVRPCYSEGGRRAGDFRAVPITDLDEAGLDRATFVSYEERRIARSDVKGEFGWLPTVDWNQL